MLDLRDRGLPGTEPPPLAFSGQTVVACYVGQAGVSGHLGPPQRGLDVMPEPVRHVGDGTGDPAKPARAGDGANSLLNRSLTVNSSAIG